MDQAIAYFREAEKLLKANEFESAEDYTTFLQNVFTEVDGMERRLAQHHDGSMMLEKFLNVATAFQTRVFFERITGDMAKLSMHRYASHVMEALLKRADHHLGVGATEGGEGEGEEQLAPLPAMLQRLSEEIGAAFDEVVFTSWGSHVYRGMVGVLEKHRPAEIGVIAENIALSESGFLHRMAFDQYGSPALQAILAAAQRLKLGSLAQMLAAIFPADSEAECRAFVSKAAQSQTASHLLEVALAAFDSAAFLAFYSASIHPEFARMLSGTPANFVLQNAVTACHNEAQLKIVLGDLKPHLGQLVGLKRAGMLVRLAQWSADHKRQAEKAVLAAVYEAFHAKSTTDKKGLFAKVARLQTDLDAAAPYAPLGCQLLSGIAAMADNKPFVDGLLDLDAAELERLALHGQGSRVLEAFLASGQLSEKAVARLLKRLQGRFAPIAADKCGSHVVEKLWQVARADLKPAIMSELAAAKRRLEETPHGRMVMRKCRVEDWERRQEGWVQEAAATERKRTYFADLLDAPKAAGEQPEKTGKKRKAKKSTEESLMLTEDRSSKAPRLML